MTRVLLDTDVLSAIMRGQPVATAKAATYLATHNQFTFSIITRYEILRGLKTRKAATQEGLSSVYAHQAVSLA